MCSCAGMVNVAAMYGAPEARAGAAAWVRDVASRLHDGDDGA